MRIELANLEEGRGEYAQVYQPQDLDLSDERVTLCGSTSVAGTVRRVGSEAFVDGHLDSCVEVACDRCLKPIEVPVSSDFSLEYITGGDYEESQTAELTDEVMSVSVFDGETIDLDEIVEEQILLAVPTRSLCKADCLGICPKCGADRNLGDCGCEDENIDPRWSALKDLMSGK
ncbi:MAG TPA: DUF177 domain-containing protein [Pyrinomonadaceae bacterium]|nr:DUF177 domain-containing protein [Pyrinomonadaceae bacterium]